MKGTNRILKENSKGKFALLSNTTPPFAENFNALIYILWTEQVFHRCCCFVLNI